MPRPPLQITARAARKPPPLPKTAKVRLSDLPPGAVREPGKPGHAGTWDHAWGGISNGKGGTVRSDWRTAARKVNRNEEYQQHDEHSRRQLGRIAYGLAGGSAAVGIGGGLAVDAMGNRRAKAIRAGKLDRRLTPVRKAVEPSMLFVRTARKAKGVHDVTSMPKKPSREQRFAHWAAGENPANILIGAGTGAGGGALLAGINSAESRTKKASQQRRAQLRRTGAVAKRFQPKLVGNALRHPSEMRRVIRENPWDAGIIAGGAGIGAAAGARDRHHPKRTAAAGAAGAGAGATGYYATGFGAIARSERLKRQGQKQGHNGLSRSAQEAIWRKHRLEQGIHQGQKTTPAQQHALHSSYPEKLPGWRTQRLAANMSTSHGKGRAILAGATLGGAAMVGGASALGHKQRVGKALYAREDRVSLIRTGELAAGGTLAAYGIANSGMVGRGIARGVKIAQRNGNEQAAEALRRAEAARGSIRIGMAPGEAALRRIHALDSAIRKVPGPIRAEVALVAGALLGARALPVRRTHYTPVSTPVPGYGSRW